MYGFTRMERTNFSRLGRTSNERLPSAIDDVATEKYVDKSRLVAGAFMIPCFLAGNHNNRFKTFYCANDGVFLIPKVRLNYRRSILSNFDFMKIGIKIMQSHKSLHNILT
jgi:hypothetical protein